MTFTKLAYAQSVIRAMTKEAGVAGELLSSTAKAGLGLGKGMVGMSQRYLGKTLGPVALVGGAAAVPATLSAGRQQTRAYNVGMNPQTQGYLGTPQG